MLPDLRPSSPFSTGPTLFLAPSPTAWQARHLLNEVLPAAASCASAPVAVANEVTTTSALKVNVFMRLSLPKNISFNTGDIQLDARPPFYPGQSKLSEIGART